MKSLIDKLDQLNGEELRDLLKNVEKVKNGSVVISGPISKEYEKYQLKNHPDTLDIAVTVVMGAPFPIIFRNSLKNLIEILERIFESYDVKLHVYADYHIHSTVSPIIRTKFDPASYLKDPDNMNKNQRQEIQKRSLNTQKIKKKVCCTKQFYIEVYPWNITIGDRGEILLWCTAKDNKGKEELSELRKRLRKIVGPHARDKGSKIHIALATIEDFHKLTGQQKKEIASKINNELEFIPVPDSFLIDRVKLVQYLHRSLSKVDSFEEIRFC